MSGSSARGTPCGVVGAALLCACAGAGRGDAIGNQSPGAALSVAAFDLSQTAQPSSRECRPAGAEWHDAESAIEAALVKRLGSALVKRRSHDPSLATAMTSVGWEEVAERSTTPIAIVFVGSQAGYTIVLSASDDAWFCIDVVRAPDKLELVPRRIPPVFWWRSDR